MKLLNPIAVILSLVSFAAPIGVSAESSASEVVRLRGEEIKYQGCMLAHLFHGIYVLLLTLYRQ